MATEVEKLELYVDHPEHDKVELWFYPNSHMYKKGSERLMGVSGIKSIIASDGLAHYFKAEAIKYFRRNFIPMNNGELVFPQTLEEFEQICKDAGSFHTQKSKRGMDTGTFVHDWLEQWFIAHRDKKPYPEFPAEMEEPNKDDDKYKEDAWAYEDDLQVATERNNLVKALKQFVEWSKDHEIEVVDLERIVLSLAYDFAGRFDAILRIDGKLYMVDFKTNNPSWDFPKGIFPDFFCQIGLYDVAYTEEHYWELHKTNTSPFDGHAVFNFSKKNGKFNREYSFDTKLNRSWAVHTIGTKRGFQHHMRNLSLKYKENRPAPKKKAVKK